MGQGFLTLQTISLVLNLKYIKSFFCIFSVSSSLESKSFSKSKLQRYLMHLRHEGKNFKETIVWFILAITACRDLILIFNKTENVNGPITKLVAFLPLMNFRWKIKNCFLANEDIMAVSQNWYIWSFFSM